MFPSKFYKNKERITGIISFLAAIGWIIAGLIIIYSEGIPRESEAGFYNFILLVIPLISTLLYIYWTDFGKKEKTELEKIEYENQLLKKKLEQKKLKGELK